MPESKNKPFETPKICVAADGTGPIFAFCPLFFEALCRRRIGSGEELPPQPAHTTVRAVPHTAVQLIR